MQVATSGWCPSGEQSTTSWTTASAGVPLPFLLFRHCEERSDEAIQNLSAALGCFASLAMTPFDIAV